jgi:hypothetical protein
MIWDLVEIIPTNPHQNSSTKQGLKAGTRRVCGFWGPLPSGRTLCTLPHDFRRFICGFSAASNRFFFCPWELEAELLVVSAGCPNRCSDQPLTLFSSFICVCSSAPIVQHGARDLFNVRTRFNSEKSHGQLNLGAWILPYFLLVNMPLLILKFTSIFSPAHVLVLSWMANCFFQL